MMTDPTLISDIEQFLRTCSPHMRDRKWHQLLECVIEENKQELALPAEFSLHKQARDIEGRILGEIFTGIPSSPLCNSLMADYDTRLKARAKHLSGYWTDEIICSWERLENVENPLTPSESILIWWVVRGCNPLWESPK